MPKIYFAGLNASKLLSQNLSEDNLSLTVFDQFTPVSCNRITDFEIGWDYVLIWEDEKVYISNVRSRRKAGNNERALIQVPTNKTQRIFQAIPGPETVIFLTETRDIWVYNFLKDVWKEVSNFIPDKNRSEGEQISKIAGGRCTVALTNFGHVFHIPVFQNNTSSVKFIDVACGFDHNLLLAANGEVYSSGTGTRGQLGHGDLEDCDEPKLIEAIAGLKVVQISAAGWHSAVVTDQGDLYTWGWNNQGQIGHPNIQNVVAVPTIVDFIDSNQKTVELSICQVQCGNSFTICQTSVGDLWGVGSNKYGQLGQPRSSIESSKHFFKLSLPSIKKPISRFKCREWGTCIYTE
ncbi:hypothetical protein QAD02_022549 [Eretmocerus hayati]|uniref:Uncharacterized protein n=1 Tax=Eretmocerus hayati TaxID=131215 RepID=A0ACC2PT32_9HYME|nr:hypothetical protein QAD02_022549 [Eretmocerus hayati]